MQKYVRFIGDEGAAMTLAKEALDWLLSPAAEGEGQRLLERAYELHGKPLEIRVCQFDQNHYTNTNGAHQLVINSAHARKTLVQAPNGQRERVSLEVVMAHELEHACQPEVAEFDQQMEALKEKLTQKHMTKLRSARGHFGDMHLQKALAAENYETAREHLTNYMYEIGLDVEKAAHVEFMESPLVEQWIDQFETNAVATQNRVARLRGEPERRHYLDIESFSPEVDDAIEMLIDIEAVKHGIHTKPRQTSLENAFWAQSVRDGGRRTTPAFMRNAADHPLIATHKAGGIVD